MRATLFTKNNLGALYVTKIPRLPGDFCLDCGRLNISGKIVFYDCADIATGAEGMAQVLGSFGIDRCSD